MWFLRINANRTSVVDAARILRKRHGKRAGWVARCREDSTDDEWTATFYNRVELEIERQDFALAAVKKESS